MFVANDSGALLDEEVVLEKKAVKKKRAEEPKGTPLNFLENVFDSVNLWIQSKHNSKEGLILVREILYSQILRLQMGGKFVYLGEVQKTRKSRLQNALEVDMRRVRLPDQLVTRGSAKKDKDCRSISDFL